MFANCWNIYIILALNRFFWHFLIYWWNFFMIQQKSWLIQQSKYCNFSTFKPCLVKLDSTWVECFQLFIFFICGVFNQDHLWQVSYRKPLVTISHILNHIIWAKSINVQIFADCYFWLTSSTATLEPFVEIDAEWVKLLPRPWSDKSWYFT